MAKYSYNWLGYGLELIGPNGSVFMQGDEANELYDELEACETDELVVLLVSAYDHVME